MIEPAIYWARRRTGFRSTENVEGEAASVLIKDRFFERSYLPLVYWLARRKTGFRWARNVLAMSMRRLMVCALVAIVALANTWAGAASGAAAAAAFDMRDLHQLVHMTSLPEPLARLASGYRKAILYSRSRRG